MRHLLEQVIERVYQYGNLDWVRDRSLIEEIEEELGKTVIVKNPELSESQILAIESAYAETGQDVDWAKRERRGQLQIERQRTEDNNS